MDFDWRGAFMRLLFGAAVGVGVTATAGAARAAETAAQWDLTDLYSTPQAWTDSYQRQRTVVASLDRYKGTLGNERRIDVHGAGGDQRHASRTMAAVRLRRAALRRGSEDRGETSSVASRPGR